MNNSKLNRPIRLAVYLDQRLHSGGGYQQALNAVLLANKIPRDLCVPICFTTVSENLKILKQHGVDTVFIPISFIQRTILNFRGSLKSQWLKRFSRCLFGPNLLERIFDDHQVELVYFTSPTNLANVLERLNYIITLWDLCHRDDLEFPEVRVNGVFEWREFYHHTVLPKALGIIVDSEVGKRNVVRRYCVDSERVHVIPFSPAVTTNQDTEESRANSFDVKLRYQLEEEYVFYPAQFWPHKNHVYILEALKILEESHGIRVGAIFCGGDAGGNLAYLRQVTSDLMLNDRVRFAGFVPNEEIPYFYLQSLALVMPTYFGPTNLPPLEAFKLSVPVVYPNKHGLREQVGDAALLVDLNNPDSLAKAIMKIRSDLDFRANLIEKGKQRLSQCTDEMRLETLSTLIQEFKVKRKCWIR